MQGCGYLGGKKTLTPAHCRDFEGLEDDKLGVSRRRIEDLEVILVTH